jgi:polysaccharide export outer membrane protein
MCEKCSGVFLARSCLSMNRIWIGWQTIALACCFLAVASGQDSPADGGQSTVIRPSDLRQPETADATNDRLLQLALMQGAKELDYVLDSGDLLNIEVFDVPELTREVRVSESGLISLPLLPVKVQAAGLTAFQLEDKLAELLLANGLVSHPQVTVAVKEQHGQPITVTGAVRTPMVIQAVREMTLLEVLARAGGIAQDAAGQILVTRTRSPILASMQEFGTVTTAEVADAETRAATGSDAEPLASTESAESPTVRIGLSDLLDTGDPKYNLIVRGGDVVSIPRAGVVYAVGAVQNPGGFVMSNDRQQLTVLKVLALSGGLTTTAKGKNAVIIRQSAEREQRQVPVNLERILAFKDEDPLLLQSDILFVPNSGSKQVMGRVAQTALGLASGVALVRLSN